MRRRTTARRQRRFSALVPRPARTRLVAVGLRVRVDERGRLVAGARAPGVAAAVAGLPDEVGGPVVEAVAQEPPAHLARRAHQVAHAALDVADGHRPSVRVDTLPFGAEQVGTGFPAPYTALWFVCASSTQRGSAGIELCVIAPPVPGPKYRA